MSQVDNLELPAVQQGGDKEVNIHEEAAKCFESVAYFIKNYCYIEDKDKGETFLFDLWPDQESALQVFATQRKVVALKARQIGMTWLVLCYALWKMIMQPNITVLLFSLRDHEAIELKSRIAGIYRRLPRWLQGRNPPSKNDAHDFWLANGSQAKAFPTGKGDSYTAALAIMDEADLPDNNLQIKMMNSIGPTVAAGGQLIMVSKADKKKPESRFKKIYREAKAGNTGWAHVFLPWWSRADGTRTKEWYENEFRTQFAQTGSNDYMYENYPATDTQALAPNELDKRIPQDWINKCYKELQPSIVIETLKHIKGLSIYREPSWGRKYAGGVDPAEGNPNSDPSALVLLDQLTGEEVLSLNAKISPRQLAQAMEAISNAYFNNCAWLVERNNHGHTVIDICQNSHRCNLIDGPDGKPGWLESLRNKTQLYDFSAERLREGECTIHSFEVWAQLAEVEGTTLRAPEGRHDDLAMAYVLAVKAAYMNKYGRFKAEDFMMTGGSAYRPFGTIYSDSNNSPFGVN